MEETLRFLIKELVNDPDQISINKREEGNTTILELKVAPDDMGKVIGRQGKIAKSIRTLMKAYGAKNNQKINVDILD
jgi:predicted RNA-binding protein YlqC (UPF0109 family)